MPGSIAQIIGDVNQQLAADLAESGQFATLFYLAADPAGHMIEWVRAGHDPAIFYDPEANEFIELNGSGMALGVEAQGQYEIGCKSSVRRGSIIVLATDGVWETRNEDGQMLGRSAMYDIILNNPAAPANEIMEGIFKKIKKFRNNAEPEDDVTLVVLKFL